MKLIFSFDTEDFVTPETDDALKGLARIATRRGITANFALVGDKARALWTRGRKDVIDAVKKHSVQYHSNTHMFWPNTSRVISRMKWDEGLDFVVDHERHGVEDVSEVFGQRPVAWVRPDGNQATREIYAMRLLGLRAFAPGTYYRTAGRPIWFVNMLLGNYHFFIDRYLKPGVGVGQMAQDFLAMKSGLGDHERWVVVGSHPCMYAARTFYDLHNIRPKGNIPPKAKWRSAPFLGAREMRRRLKVFEELVDLVQRRKDIEVATYREMIESYEEGDRWLTPVQLLKVARAARDDFNFQKLGRGHLAVADICAAVSLALTRWLREGALPPRVPVRRVLGPPEPARKLGCSLRASARQVAAACSQIEHEIDTQHRLPSTVTVKDTRTPPATFFAGMVDALERAMAGTRGTVALVPRPTHPRCRDEIFGEVGIGAHSLPPDFDPGTIRTYTHQQSWTARPAVSTQD